jgi:hypothetical protein
MGSAHGIDYLNVNGVPVPLESHTVELIWRWGKLHPCTNGNWCR